MPKCTPTLRKLRLQAQLSQNRLARAAQLDRQTISNAERGMEITELSLAKLLAALGKALDREIVSRDISTEDAG